MASVVISVSNLPPKHRFNPSVHADGRGSGHETHTGGAEYPDGVHSISAQCVLRVLIITEDMLASSVTVRLQNMSQEHFLSPLLGHFLEGVSAVLSVPVEDVFVFNVQPDLEAAGGGPSRGLGILNVSFSAALPGGHFFPSEALEEQLYLNRPRLTALAQMEVLPFDDNVCLREPCQNYMKCISVLRFNSSAPFISSPSILFRPIHPIAGLRCRCPAGFTGDYCETEINLCYSNPCLNGGVCARTEGGFTCICREDYTDVAVLPFDDNVCLREPCQNYMKCISVLRFNSSAPFISSPSILFRPIHPIAGLRCRCPAGFTGDYCETEINLCYSNPCLNGGVCARTEGGFTCICREDYTVSITATSARETETRAPSHRNDSSVGLLSPVKPAGQRQRRPAMGWMGRNKMEGDEMKGAELLKRSTEMHFM
ncbi:hypothetical protein CRUP_032049 [Coryphaenoides rupestris]|nr:hypothetical protein CRUP_032049 [Coryphaenoides rupestris]